MDVGVCEAIDGEEDEVDAAAEVGDVREKSEAQAVAKRMTFDECGERDLVRRADARLTAAVGMLAGADDTDEGDAVEVAAATGLWPRFARVISR